MAELFEAAHQSAGGSFRAEPVKVIASQFLIDDRLGQQKISDHRDAMRDRDDGLLDATARRHTIEQRRQVSILAVRGRPRRLTETTAQVDISFTRPAGLALARALTIARTQPRPTGQMRG